MPRSLMIGRFARLILTKAILPCCFEPKDAGDPRCGTGIRGMGDAIHDPDLRKIEGAGAFDAGDVDTELVRVRAALMVGIDAAGLAEIMLCRAGVELVERQIVFAFYELDIRKLSRDGDGAAHAAVGAGAAANRVEFVRQPDPDLLLSHLRDLQLDDGSYEYQNRILSATESGFGWRVPMATVLLTQWKWRRH